MTDKDYFINTKLYYPYDEVYRVLYEWWIEHIDPIEDKILDHEHEMIRQLTLDILKCLDDQNARSFVSEE